jgi:uncharacterized 2Fe-2S/4Fe-4S cluster protein (DUF4445 family)
VAEEALIVFTPSGRRGRFALGTPILTAARSLGVDIDSVCGGRGLCGRCQITLSEGEFAKHGIASRLDNLTGVNEVEARYDGKQALKPGRRLSCQAELRGDVVIDVPPDSQVHKQVVRKRAEVRDIELDPAIRLHYVEVEEPDMHNPSGDLERLNKALREQWELPELECDLMRPQGVADAAEGSARRSMEGHSLSPSRHHPDQCLARLRRPGLRARGRRRVDHHRGPPLQSLDRRGGGLLGHHEPADPLR